MFFLIIHLGGELIILFFFLFYYFFYPKISSIAILGNLKIIFNICLKNYVLCDFGNNYDYFIITIFSILDLISFPVLSFTKIT
jgi:hypothetical protein